VPVDDIWDRRLGVWYLAEDHPDAAAIAESPDGTWTYGELAGSAHRLVHALRGIDLPDDAIVAVLAGNGVLPVQVSLACSEAGWNLLLLNTYLTPAEITTILEHAGAAVLITDERHAAVLDADGGATIRELATVIVRGGTDRAMALEDLCAGHPDTRPESLAAGGMIAYSSGTTGAPKGIVRKGNRKDPAVAAHRAALFGRAFDFRPREGPHLVSTAMYHGGSHSYYMGALNVGHALAIMPRFDAEETLAVIERTGVHSAYMVPTQFHRLLQLPADIRDKYDMSSLHSVVHSAAPCPRPIKQAMLDWWGPVIWETYGGMEGAATIAKPHRWLEKPGTVGRAVRGVRLAILDDDGHELGPNETGHIYFGTAAGFSYHDDDAQTRAAHNGDLFTIGDIGYIDDDGYLFLQDRAKDMIISGGVNIFPAEIEAVLLEHSGVGDAAVIGIPDDDWGEQVLAVIEPRSGVAPTDDLAEALLAHCADRLAAYKRPRRIEFRAELPRTDAGKLYKRKLRDEYWADENRAL
jgi:long-chain acyl-CoA synthetase